MFDTVRALIAEGTEQMTVRNGVIEISYTFLSYDLIDMELDFDEFEYNQLRRDFNIVMLRNAQKEIDEGRAFEAIISQHLMVMRNYVREEQVLVTDYRRERITTYENSSTYTTFKEDGMQAVECSHENAVETCV